MRKRCVLSAGVLVLACVGGCASQPTLESGAERVRVVSSEEAVKGGTLVDTWSGSIGGLRVGELPIDAQNFAFQRGANVALVRQYPSAHVTAFTIEAWKVPAKP